MGFLGKMLHKRLKKKLGLTKMQKTIDAIPASIASGDAKIIKAIEGLGEGGLGEEQTNFSEEAGITNTVDPTMSAPDIGGVLNPPATFDPASKEAAAGMFGKPMDDSFDRDMGTEEIV